jgi:hypothetical protein
MENILKKHENNITVNIPNGTKGFYNLIIENKHGNIPEDHMFVLVSIDGKFEMGMTKWSAQWGLYRPVYGDRCLLPNQDESGFIYEMNIEDVDRIITRLINYYP